MRNTHAILIIFICYYFMLYYIIILCCIIYYNHQFARNVVYAVLGNDVRLCIDNGPAKDISRANARSAALPCIFSQASAPALASAAAAGGAPEPPLPAKAPGWLTDAARLFEADDAQRLELLRILSALEASTGAEAAVVTLPRLPSGSPVVDQVVYFLNTSCHH